MLVDGVMLQKKSVLLFVVLFWLEEYLDVVSLSVARAKLDSGFVSLAALSPEK